MEIRGSVIAVTGGAHGIGRALCERFAAEGAKAVAVLDIDGEGDLDYFIAGWTDDSVLAGGAGERTGIRKQAGENAGSRAESAGHSEAAGEGAESLSAHVRTDRQSDPGYPLRDQENHLARS